MSAAAITAVLQTRTHHAALERPVVRAAFKRAVGNIVASVVIHFDVVHQTFARVQQANLGVINAWIIICAIVQHSGEFDVGPS